MNHTMKPLPPENYPSAVSMLNQVVFNHYFVRSVLEKHVSGKVYADDTANPRAFYVVHPYGMSLLYGDVRDDFLKGRLQDYLLGLGGSRTESEWLQVSPAELEGRIDAILGDRMIIYNRDEDRREVGTVVVKHERVNFRFNLQKFERFLSEVDPGEYNFREMDASVFKETDGSVVPKKFWNNASDFASRGVGFALMAAGRVAAVAFSAFVHAGILELGMETKAEYRRRGYGGKVSARLIEYCLEKGLEPVWSCRRGNSASYNMAIKLGFEPTVCLPYYELLK